MATEIYDYGSPTFGSVLVYGREYRIVNAQRSYESLYTLNQSPFQEVYGGNYIRVPDFQITLTLRAVPPPPPPKPKRTWATAMGLRRPGR